MLAFCVGKYVFKRLFFASIVELRRFSFSIIFNLLAKILVEIFSGELRNSLKCFFSLKSASLKIIKDHLSTKVVNAPAKGHAYLTCIFMFTLGHLITLIKFSLVFCN